MRVRQGVRHARGTGFALLLLLTGAQGAESDGPDPARIALGQAVNQRACARCHADDGNGGATPVKAYPKLAGLDEAYLYKQILDLKAHRRPNPATDGRGERLEEPEVRAIAAFYARQAMTLGDPDGLDEAARARVAALFRQGDAARGLPPCASCHGDAGEGRVALLAPRLAGQWSPYLATQLRRFRDGSRRTSALMEGVAQRLSEAEIEPLAAYLGGLH
ncbi:cytochrome c4 [Pseudomonas sp. RIT-PI-AD]|uniref:c-type cytochrome n=1 Tax=Pseudomonas sp. RIT-PI-AD TaxID=3035294 RepID=UPI0021D9C0B9|nr:cytochrome c4 [Pseudomonas sp. RIT-PI-AD]